MVNNAFKLYDKLLNKCETQYSKLPEDQNKMISVINKPGMLRMLAPMPPLEGDKEPEETIAERVKLNTRKRKNEGTGLKILTPHKLLNRLPILLAEIKAGNNSDKLKNEITQILYILHQHNKITNKIYSNLIKSL